MKIEDYQNQDLEPGIRAADLLKRLDLREKVGQINQTLYGFRSYERVEGEIVLSEDLFESIRYWGGLGVLYGLYRTDPWTQKDLESGLNKDEMIAVYNQIQRAVITESRFAIPVLFSQESPHGSVSLDSYLLPVNLAAGASFNPQLYQAACSVAGKELNEAGVQLALVSMLDLVRDPRWGRSEECFSEDPFLASSMARAAVRGYSEAGAPVVAKVFIAHGEGSGGINAAAAKLGERELHEIHVPPVVAASDAGAVGVMAAYNEIDGIYCHANSYLLRTVLRDEIGFDGIVMADGLAIDKLNLMTGDTLESAAMALRAGVDVSLWDEAYTRLEEAVKRHPELEANLDAACERVLRLKFASGLYDKPYLEEAKLPLYTVDQYPQSLDLARESIVLLTNHGEALPLKKDKSKITAVIGPHVRDVYTHCGDYTPYLRPEQCCSIADGLGRAGKVLVEEGCGIRRRSELALERARSIAAEADQVILTLGGSSSRFGESSFAANGALAGMPGDVDCGEGVDLADLNLADAQLELFREIRRITRERAIPLITVIVAGRAYAIAEVAEQSDALIYSLYPGPMGGLALADVIYGLAPAGRLPLTLPRTNLQIPCYYNHQASYEPRYADAEADALFEFGFGLTYTSFDLENVRLSATTLTEGETIDIEVKIRNSGPVRAAAVLQLYIRQGRSSRVPRVSELKAFTKQEIESGETADMFLSLRAEDLKVWSVNKRWELEEGPYSLSIKDQGKLLWRDTIQVRKNEGKS